MISALRGAVIIGGATLLEAIRNRLLLVGMMFGLVLVVASVGAASVALWEQTRLIIDVGLASASALGSIMIIALAITSFSAELNRRTAYALLVRPPPRWAFVLGKFFGITAAMYLVVASMVVSTAITVWIYGGSVGAAFWGSAWLTLIEVTVVGAIALLFATLSGPVLAASYSTALLIAGNLADDLLLYAERLERSELPGPVAILRTIYWMLPDLSSFSLRTQAANGLDGSIEYVISGTVYGLAYAIALLVLATGIFSRRKLF